LTLRRSAAPLLGVLAAGCLFRLGNAFAAVALPWLVLDLSGSGLWAGAIASASLIALVIGAFFGGALIDRHGARRVAIIAGLASAVCVGAVPAIVQLGPEALPFIAVLVAAGALLDSPGMTAQDNRIPELARLGQIPLARAVSLKSLIGNASFVAGPALAGISIGFGGASVALVIAFTCSMLSALLIAVWLSEARRRTKRNNGGMLSAFGFIFRAPPLAYLTLLVMVVVGFTSTTTSVLLPSLFHQAARAPQEFGLAASSIGAGSLCGALLLTIFPKLAGQFTALLVIVASLAMVPVALLPPLPAILPLAFIYGLLLAPLGVALNTTLFIQAPQHLRGRVQSASAVLTLAAGIPIALLTGLLVETLGSGMALMACMLATALATMCTQLWSRSADAGPR
jgi:macrolide resistance protein